MSHFTVAVFTEENQTIEELLAPYQENNMEDCPAEYLQFYCVEEEYRDKYENDGVEMVKTPDGRLLYPWDDEFKENGQIGYSGVNHKVIQEKGCGKVFVKHKDFYPDFESFMADWAGYSKDPETGKYGYWENPNAKWDWYQVGGRYSGMLKLKPSATSGDYGSRSWTNKDEIIPEYKVDTVKVKDIDFSLDENVRKEALRYWEIVVEKDSPQNEKEEEIEKFAIINPEYLINKYGTKEEFAKIKSMFSTHAVITPDGQWYEPGEVGMFGTCSASEEEEFKWKKEFKERFIDTANPEWVLTVVDCHI